MEIILWYNDYTLKINLRRKWKDSGEKCEKTWNGKGTKKAGEWVLGRRTDVEEHVPGGGNEDRLCLLTFCLGAFDAITKRSWSC